MNKGSGRRDDMSLECRHCAQFSRHENPIIIEFRENRYGGTPASRPWHTARRGRTARENCGQWSEALLLIGSAAGGAQTWPEKTVMIVAPLPGRRSVDLVAHAVAHQLGEDWKQPVIISNRPAPKVK